MRIGKTINYLLYTDFTLEELAEILGFVDSAHISKVFLTRIGDERQRIPQYLSECGKHLPHPGPAGFLLPRLLHLPPITARTCAPKDVGAQFHMSHRELNRILLYQVEMGFSDFLNYVRVNRASELLLRTDKTILEIALEVGYHTEKTLTRNFLRFRSMTPGKFRQTVELQESS